MKHSSLSLLLLPLLLGGCDALMEGVIGDLRHLSSREVSGSDGTITLDVDVTGEEAMLLTLQADDGALVFVDQVTDPSGTVAFSATDAWNDASHSVTMGAYPFPTSSINWPANGGSLTDGTWQIRLGTVDSAYYYQPGTGVQVDVLLKDDPSMSSGTLHVNLVYAGAAGTDEELARAAGVATAHWEEIYGQIGIDLTFEEWEYDNGALPGPGLGNAEDFIQISTSTSTRSVNVVLVPSMVDGDGIYGMAGGIPGALVPTDRSAVVISALTSSGPDLMFSAEEERIFAETMAHEVGHYLGLFHPVETSWDTWDSLGDTPECSGEGTCEQQLGSNLMFPYPVCSYTSCTPQADLTPQQSSAAHSYVGVE
ncbi:MAG: hypothetical protein JXX28_19695 [Deltaproteobacteria bacterium]|nr:hypothetical protein [Deltaproteobacteria bacterium]